jgi:hypothetical protein
MSSQETPKKLIVKKPLVTLTPCQCGQDKYREASRITLPANGISIMYACIDCGKQRL